MSANYWTSSQRRHWTFTPTQLATLHDNAAAQNASVMATNPYPDRRHLFIWFRDRLSQLGKRLPLRQQAYATAMVYLHRYFVSNIPQNVNLYLLLSAAFYLASKTEESPHHIRLVASEARQAWPEFVPGDISRLGEMEFILISEMRSQLIVWHPYRSLLTLKENPELKLGNEEVALAWTIVNDSFATEMCLTIEPHLLACVAVFLAVIFWPVARREGLGLPGLGAGEALFGTTLGGRGMHGASYGGVLSNLSMGAQALSTPSMAQSQTVAGASALQGGSSAGGGGGAVAPGAKNTPLTKEQTQALLREERMQNMIRFLVESGVDVHRMIESTQELISLYECWESMNEKTIKDAIARNLKSRGLDC